MNAREFFYKDYFTHRVGNAVFNPGKPESQEAFKEIKAHNRPLIDDANNKLKKFELHGPDYNCLRLTHDGIPDHDIVCETTYPGLLIGTGYMHQSDNEGEFKMGFYFDFTCGIPCIPGSSVKGVLRSVFPLLSHNLYDIREEPTELQETKLEYIARLAGWDKLEKEQKQERVHQLELAVFEGADLKKSDKEKGMEYCNIYDRFVFHNAFISAAKNNLIFETDTITPHVQPLKNPVPLNFLKIRPGVKFTFQFQLQDLPALGLKKENLRNLFEAILKDTGIGAKTNVGYGQFKQ